MTAFSSLTLLSLYTAATYCIVQFFQLRPKEVSVVVDLSPTPCSMESVRGAVRDRGTRKRILFPPVRVWGLYGLFSVSVEAVHCVIGGCGGGGCSGIVALSFRFLSPLPCKLLNYDQVLWGTVDLTNTAVTHLIPCCAHVLLAFPLHSRSSPPLN